MISCKTIAIQSAAFPLAFRDVLGEKIRGNYLCFGLSVQAEDLILMTMQPSLLTIEQGRYEIMYRVLNQLINRILFFGSAGFTYQDEVFVSTLLPKLGIRDIAGFMTWVKQYREKRESESRLLEAYRETAGDAGYRAKIISQVKERMTAEREGTEAGRERERPLHLNILRRLHIGRLWENLYRHLPGTKAGASLHMLADGVSLETYREGMMPLPSPNPWRQEDFYDTVVSCMTSVFADPRAGENKITDVFASAVLLHLLQKAVYERQDGRSWRDYASYLAEAGRDAVVYPAPAGQDTADVYASDTLQVMKILSEKMMFSENAFLTHEQENNLLKLYRDEEKLVRAWNGIVRDRNRSQGGAEDALEGFARKICLMLSDNYNLRRQTVLVQKSGSLLGAQASDSLLDALEELQEEEKLLLVVAQKEVETEQEISRETWQESRQETQQKIRQETLQEISRETLQRVRQEISEEISRETLQEIRQEISRETQQGISQEIQQGVGHKITYDIERENNGDLVSHGETEDAPVLFEHIMPQGSEMTPEYRQYLEWLDQRNRELNGRLQQEKKAASPPPVIKTDKKRVMEGIRDSMENPEKTRELLREMQRKSQSPLPPGISREAELLLRLADESTRTRYEKILGVRVEGAPVRAEEPAYTMGKPIYQSEEPVYTMGEPVYQSEGPAYRVGEPVYRLEETAYTTEKTVSSEEQGQTARIFRAEEAMRAEESPTQRALFLQETMRQAAQTIQSVTETIQSVTETIQSVTETETQIRKASREGYDVLFREYGQRETAVTNRKSSVFVTEEEAVAYLSGIVRKLSALTIPRNNSPDGRQEGYEAKTAALVHKTRDVRGGAEPESSYQMPDHQKNTVYTVENHFLRETEITGENGKLTGAQREQINEIVRSQISTRLNTLSDRVYQKLDRRLREEQKRKGY